MIELIEKFNQLVFSLFNPDFYKKIPAKTIAIVAGSLFVIFLIAVTGFSIRKTLIKNQLVKTHDALKTYVETVKRLDESVSDMETLGTSMTSKSSVHRFNDDIKQFDADYKDLQKAHLELQKEDKKAPSQDTEAYFNTIRSFDSTVFAEYSEGSKVLHSTQKMVAVAEVAREQKFDELSMSDVHSKEDLMGKFDELKKKFEAVHAALPQIKGDEYYDVYYQPMNTAMEKLISNFDKINTALRNDDLYTLEQLTKDYKKDMPDMDSIDTYKLEKAVKDSQKRVTAINSLVPKLNEQDKAVLKSYDIITEDQLPYFMKQKMFRNMDSFKDNKILDLPVNRL